MRPYSYDGAAAGGLYLDGEIYPLAGQGKHLARLGASLVIDRAVGLSSQLSMNGSTTEFDTVQSRWGLGLRYALPVSDGAIVKLAAGYDQLEHTIDASGVNVPLPDVSYSYLDIGAGAYVPLGKEIAVNADARYLHVLSAGEIQDADKYGTGNVVGLDVDANLEYRMSPTIHLRAGVRYLRMAFDFDGSGSWTTELDGDPDQDVGGASDTYLGGYMTAGYTF
jgi:hypothetical protein